MSKTHHDQRSRPHSGKRCPEAAGGGCVYCRTGQYKHASRRTLRQSKNRVIRESLRND